VRTHNNKSCGLLCIVIINVFLIILNPGISEALHCNDALLKLISQRDMKSLKSIKEEIDRDRARADGLKSTDLSGLPLRKRIERATIAVAIGNFRLSNESTDNRILLLKGHASNTSLSEKMSLIAQGAVDYEPGRGLRGNGELWTQEDNLYLEQAIYSLKLASKRLPSTVIGDADQILFVFFNHRLKRLTYQLDAARFFGYLVAKNPKPGGFTFFNSGKADDQLINKKTIAVFKEQIKNVFFLLNALPNSAHLDVKSIDHLRGDLSPDFFIPELDKNGKVSGVTHL
jgi:hypothetical protein